MSRIPDTDWRVGLRVTHPTFNEPQVMREARVLQRMRVFLEVNGEDLHDKELQKMEKVINTRLLSIMDEIRDATP